MRRAIANTQRTRAGTSSPRAPVATEVATAQDVRRAILSLAALDGRRPTSSSRAVAAMVRRLGYVQIDSINVLERAHHLILATRLRDYRHSHLSSNLERSRSLFEHWTHDACAIPVAWYSHWKHRFTRSARTKSRNQWWDDRFDGDPDPVLRRTLDRVRRDGPLRGRDFESQRLRRGQGWWDWHPEKAALEHLWRCGELAIARREGFEKVYDLAERVFPDHHPIPASDEAEHDEWACREAIDRLGVATPREIAAFFKAIPIERAATWCRRAVAEGRLVPLDVIAISGRRVACVARPDWREFAIEPQSEEIVALCPFDPLIRDRSRLERLFGVSYRFEAFVPAAKRQFGYYVLPLLQGDRIVGRIDPKLDRERRRLLVRGPWWEDDHLSQRDSRRRERSLDAALARLASAVQADDWTVERP